MKKLLTFFLLLMMVVQLPALAKKREVYSYKDYKYALLDDGTAEITKYSGEDREISIPSEIDGKVVSTISDSAFSSCKYLTSVVIPNSITDIIENPFSRCSSLSKIFVSPDHPTLATIDNVLFCKTDKRLICYPQGLVLENYTVPQGIAIIGKTAFSGCSNLTAISLPDTLTVIESGAFADCTGLEAITFPDSLDTIQNGAFAGCWRLTSVNLPTNLTTLGRGAFYECSCLTSVTIPDSLITIEANPFVWCNQLSEIVVTPDHPTLAMIEGALFSKPDKRLICYPMGLTAEAYTVPEGIEVIGVAAFSQCFRLTSVVLPDSLTSIDESAFSGCSGLTTIAFPGGLNYIGSLAFFSCSSLISVTLPATLNVIGYNTFARCDNLVLTVEQDSYAKQYCDENGLRYNYPDSNEWLNG